MHVRMVVRCATSLFGATSLFCATSLDWEEVSDNTHMIPLWDLEYYGISIFILYLRLYCIMNCAEYHIPGYLDNRDVIHFIDNTCSMWKD